AVTYRAISPLTAVVLAFAISGVIIALLGSDPIAAYSTMFQGAFGSTSSLATTGVRMTPILFTGLSVALSFRAGVFNIGAEGQLYAGAALSTAVALLPITLPAPIFIFF